MVKGTKIGEKVVEGNESLKLKESGNQLFREGDWDGALKCYTEALSQCNLEKEKATLHKNLAAVHLKQDNYDLAILECNKSLNYEPNDPKTLYRRCQAFEALEKYEEAYKDARAVHNLEPKSSAIQPVLSRLHEIVQNRILFYTQTTNKVQQMFDLAFDGKTEESKRTTALNNLLVLSRESSGIELMYEKEIVEKLASLMKVNSHPDVHITGIRIIGGLCFKSLKRTKEIVSTLGVPWFIDKMNSQSNEQTNAAEYVIDSILEVLTDKNAAKDRGVENKALIENKKEIDSIMSLLMVTTSSHAMCGAGRDAILELLIKYVDWNAADWSFKFIEGGGLVRLMDIAGEVPDYRHESSLPLTDSTKTDVALLMAKLYENMYYDAAKKSYTDKIEEYINTKLRDPEIASKVVATVAITTLLLGPIDVGSYFLGKEGVLQMMIAMASSDDIVQQRVAAEAIIAAASKKDKVASIVTQGSGILKALYASKCDTIKVRALVGLCKLGSAGGTDASKKYFADGSTLRLAEACRKFLVNPAKDRDMRRWAIEGLSYLTLDAEVKEKLIEDNAAITAMIELAKSGNMNCVYGVVTTLVNLTNSYDKQEIIPEMIELAKFAKQHVPEEHEFDDPDFVRSRIESLAKQGITNALVALGKTESENSRELLARVFNAICAIAELRGVVVQQGGVKTLLSLALEGTEKGKRQAAQSLARIAITMNPEVAFPGQRSCEVVRPLLSLLHPSCTGLENFEALMGLTNLAGMNDVVRKRMVTEGAISRIEQWMYEDHVQIKRAALQCICNLFSNEEVVKVYEGKNDRVKYFLLMCEDDDDETRQAVAGGLAMLTSVSKRCCHKILEVERWEEILQFLLANPSQEVQHRGAVVVNNIISTDKETAQKVADAALIFDILRALSNLEMTQKLSETQEKVQKLARATLKAAEDWKVVQKNPDDDSDVD